MDEMYEKLIIRETNQCSICGKEFKYKLKNWKFSESSDLFEIKIKTEHPSCLSLLKRLEKLKIKVMESEYELFRKRI
jgi:hypothetical protein